MKKETFFPMDGEFTPPGTEVSTTGREQNDFGAEYSVSADEIWSTGAEQDTYGAAAPQKRKRRRPAMLAAAVITAAAVVFAPAETVDMPTEVTVIDYPVLELTEGSKAYLDEVRAVLEEPDPERILALTNDGQLRTLTLDEIEPYAQMLYETYGLPTFYDYDTWNGDVPLEGGRHSGIFYDGEAMRYVPDEERTADHMSVEYYVRSFDDSKTTYNRFRLGLTAGEDSTSYSCFATVNSNDFGSSVSYTAGHITSVAGEDGGYYAVPLQGSELRALYSGIANMLCRFDGEFSIEQGFDELGNPNYYFENGTLTLHYWMEGYYDKTLELEVVDGTLQLTDPSVYVEYDENRGLYMLLVNISGYGTSEITSGEAESEEDFLYHLPRIYY